MKAKTQPWVLSNRTGFRATKETATTKPVALEVMGEESYLPEAGIYQLGYWVCPSNCQFCLKSWYYPNSLDSCTQADPEECSMRDGMLKRP
jgi:hypothetical protein